MKQLAAQRATEVFVQRSRRAGFVPTALRLAVCGLLGSSLGLQAQTPPAAPVAPDKDAVDKTAKPAVPAAADKAQSAELPTVVVTATRNATNLMKTPVAVSALNPDDLVRQNVKDVMDLSGMVPNLQLGLSNGDSGVLAAIRGVTSTNFTEIGDPAVGIHIDGIYSPRPQGSLALMFDLDQVEVLRGAQGTLFGRNSTAGVVNIIPAKPDFKSNYGWASLQLGNYKARQTRAVYNLALADNFAVRAAVMVDKRDSYLTQEQDLRDRGVKMPDGSFTPDGKPDTDQRLNRKLSPSEYYNNSDQWGARVTARWALSKALEWTVGAEHYKNGSAGDIGLKDCAMAAGTQWACGPEGQWHAIINVPGKLDMTIDTLRSNLTWKLNDSTELGYKLAFAKQKRYQQHDDDGGQTWLDSDVDAMQEWGNWGRQHAIDWASYTLNSNYRSWVHEVQLKQSGPTWRYVAGLFSLNEKNAIDFAQDNLVAAPYAMPQGQFYAQPDRRIGSKAFFMQGDMLLADKLTGTLGMRYSRDQRSDKGGISAGLWDASEPWYYNGLYTPPQAPGLGTPHNGTDLTFGMGPFAGLGVYPVPTENTHSMNWSKTTWRGGLQYDIDKSRMVFASLATGYRPGGFGDKFDTCGGGTCTDGSTQKYSFLEYGPETTKNLEFGYKGRHFGNTLDLSAVAFFTKYQGMHVTGTNAVGQKLLRPGETCPDWNPACDIVAAWKTENIGDADIRGLELEFKVLPWRDGRFTGFFALLDSKVKTYPTYDDNWMCGYRAQFGAEPCAPVYLGDDPAKRGRAILDVRGHQLPYAPKYSLGLTYSHDIALGENYTLTPTVSTRWQSRMYFTVRNLDNAVIGDYQKPYANWNASFRLAQADGKWDVELWGTNLTNNIVKNWMGQGNAGGYTYNSYSAPRMYGVRGTVYF
ncbi:TonB-dependent receptor [Aquabacterium sp.]|uniref:TonB-dependent receptor n=1 Tax=Aquabacterium sp. TaxID=1872578 RepID=UPI002B50868D|nr:TonB-dependent receptor [Aquabacterium sp.]HSW07925.1 TonB-dependent receptor [Aquabacterium sp.]